MYELLEIEISVLFHVFLMAITPPSARLPFPPFLGPVARPLESRSSLGRPARSRPARLLEFRRVAAEATADSMPPPPPLLLLKLNLLLLPVPNMLLLLLLLLLPLLPPAVQPLLAESAVRRSTGVGGRVCRPAAPPRRPSALGTSCGVGRHRVASRLSIKYGSSCRGRRGLWVC